MTTFQKTVTRDFRKIAKNILEGKFVWKGREFDCTLSYGEMTQVAIDLGGSVEKADLTIAALLEDFPNANGRPKINEEVTVDEVTFDVMSEPVVDSGSALLLIRCNRPKAKEYASGGGELVA